MTSIVDIVAGDYVKIQGRLKKILSTWGVGPGGTLQSFSGGGFGVVIEEGITLHSWEIDSYHKAYEVDSMKSEEKYTVDHPDLDYDKLYDACLYALQQIYVGKQKEIDSLPCSAEEHYSMAYRKLRDAMKPICDFCQNKGVTRGEVLSVYIDKCPACGRAKPSCT